jgi:hypothetical protein
MGFKCFIQNVFKKMFFQRKHEKNNEYSDVLTVFKGDLIVTEILNGSDVVDELFLQVFGHPAPRHGIHVVTFCRMSDGSYRVANYLNYWIKGDACYIGGVITDKDLVRHQVSKELRSTIRQQGGFAKIAIMYVLDHNIDKVKVYFGHTAIPVILRIIDGLGFKSTDQDYLYAKWAPGVTAAQQRKLLAEAAKVGAF